ncbi:MAG: molybdenum cofactor biosynthesis protein MoaE [Anaerolineae bacterium]
MREKLFEVTEAPLSVDEINGRVTSPAAGAIVTFTGIVRATNQGRQVRYLEYEAYPEMAEAVLAQIGDEVKARWTVAEVAIVHRTGQLEIGEASVVIAIASAHRQGAFEAARYAIDRIKQIVPVWKKEYFEGGEVWIEGPSEPPEPAE